MFNPLFQKINIMLIGLESLLSILSVLLCLYIYTTIVFRRPVTSTKISFGVFSLFLIFWNVLVFFNKYDIYKTENHVYAERIIKILTVFFLAVFALNFPAYRRREMKLISLISFIGGIGFVIIALTSFIPYIQINRPDSHLFYINLNDVLVQSFSLFSLTVFVLIVVYRLISSIQKLKFFLYKSILIWIVFTISTITCCYAISESFSILSIEINVVYINSLFLIFSILSIYNFQIIHHYPGLISFFIEGEIPILMMEIEASVNKNGCIYLKEELWKFYETEKWYRFIDEFWFNILIDETIDNALEHGGKRIDDQITVRIFQTSKNIDFYIIDSGKGFDPSSIPNPLDSNRKDIPTGRGIYILKQLYEVSWNFLGNEVRVRVSKNSNENPHV